MGGLAGSGGSISQMKKGACGREAVPRDAEGYGYDRLTLSRPGLIKAPRSHPHFFLGLRNRKKRAGAGLKAFRETEYKALREHARNRSAAMTRKRESKSGTSDLFADHDADMREASVVDDIVKEQMTLAKERLLQTLTQGGPRQFAKVVDALLQAFMLRETNVKDICVELAREGKIQNTWGTGNWKPTDQTKIASA